MSSIMTSCFRKIQQTTLGWKQAKNSDKITSLMLNITSWLTFLIQPNTFIYEISFYQEAKKSKLLLGKNNSKEDENVEGKSEEQLKNKFNLSNDEYYSAKNSECLCNPHFQIFYFQDLSTNSPLSIRHVLTFFSAENLV